MHMRRLGSQLGREGDNRHCGGGQRQHEQQPGLGRHQAISF
jgi:hypothetical protein